MKQEIIADNDLKISLIVTESETAKADKKIAIIQPGQYNMDSFSSTSKPTSVLSSLQTYISSEENNYLIMAFHQNNDLIRR